LKSSNLIFAVKYFEKDDFKIQSSYYLYQNWIIYVLMLHNVIICIKIMLLYNGVEIHIIRADATNCTVKKKLPQSNKVQGKR
jgi:hypothetical protein